MEIIVKVDPIKIEGAKKVNSLSDITDNSRLFYELGHSKILKTYIDREGVICNDTEWIREGIFIEVRDVKKFIKDERMLEKKYIEHHNFRIVYKNM